MTFLKVVDTWNHIYQQRFLHWFCCMHCSSFLLDPYHWQRTLDNSSAQRNSRKRWRFIGRKTQNATDKKYFTLLNDHDSEILPQKSCSRGFKEFGFCDMIPTMHLVLRIGLLWKRSHLSLEHKILHFGMLVCLMVFFSKNSHLPWYWRYLRIFTITR